MLGCVDPPPPSGALPSSDPRKAAKERRAKAALSRFKPPSPVPRTQYPLPYEQSLVRVVMQNVTLCGLGGLQHECPELLFRLVPRATAQRPSNCQLYISGCMDRSTPIHLAILDQLSVTAGRYNAFALHGSGLALGDRGLEALLPVVARNRGISVLCFRHCNLTSHGVSMLLDVLLAAADEAVSAADAAAAPSPCPVPNARAEAAAASPPQQRTNAAAAPRRGRTDPMSAYAARSSLRVLDLSCNHAVKDDCVPKLQALVNHRGSRLRRISLQKCGVSHSAVTAMGRRLHEQRAERRAGAVLYSSSEDEMTSATNTHCGPAAATGSKRPVPPAQPPLAAAATSSRKSHHTARDDSRAGMMRSATTFRSDGCVTTNAAPHPFVLTKDEFREALGNFARLMNRSTCCIDMQAFADAQPHSYNVLQSRIANRDPPVEAINFIVYLEALFPVHSRQNLLRAVEQHSEYAVVQDGGGGGGGGGGSNSSTHRVAPVDDGSGRRLRPDQRADMKKMFDAIDHDGDGVVTREQLHAMLSETGREAADHVMAHLKIDSVDLAAFITLTAPYLALVKQRRRWR